MTDVEVAPVLSVKDSVRADSTLSGAVDLARAAAESIADPRSVGDHLGGEAVGERLLTHYFACSSRAYPGWRWAVTLARGPRVKVATVCETHLVPGDGSLLSPPWVPYADRLAPGDVGPGDVTPFLAEDPLLEAGFEATGEEDVDAVAQWELGLGRVRVISREGRAAAATRWYEGDNGPTTAHAEKAPAKCGACGYFLPMAGALRVTFGVCANEWSPSDGRVVSLDHGCGAHSEAGPDAAEPEPLPSPILDDFLLDTTSER